jgi:hypothetical protein
MYNKVLEANILRKKVALMTDQFLECSNLRYVLPVG